MTVTDGLITEADRLAVVAGILESTIPATTRGLIDVAQKMGVPSEAILEAADGHNQGALMETDVSVVIRGYLGECG
ncbi:hypothetical protein [Marinobacterium stanieri]|uniref:hypothetical protein n=1 Tax=Marinobacterium stanieri TaxID=49186 RepID=UPI00025588B2|nr:hypothetical protein [Marinobacterium stanieri]